VNILLFYLSRRIQLPSSYPTNWNTLLEIRPNFLKLSKLSFLVSFTWSRKVRCFHHVSPPRLFLPKILPSTGVTLFQRYYDLSDLLTPFRLPRFYTCRPILLFLSRMVRTSHVPLFAFVACRALRPRGCYVSLPITFYVILPSGLLTPSAIPTKLFSWLNHFSFRLRPTTSLSTLSTICYQITPKTQYEMCLVALFR